MVQIRLLTIIMLLACNLSFAGGITSSGGDNLSADDGSAWYLGARPVRYCYLVSAEFGPTTATLEATLKTVFSQWRNYIQNKKINEPRTIGKGGTYNSGNLPVSKMQIIFNSEALANCDGSEDLKIYFGVINDEVKTFRKQYTNPTAFAQRTHFDGVKGWGKGFVWIAPPDSIETKYPNWTLPYRLKGILLHEIGHVLGNAHVSGTIMDELMGTLVLATDVKESEAKARFNQIDNSHELYFCNDCSNQYFGDSQDSTNKNAFLLLVGKSPIGTANSKFQVINDGKTPPTRMLTLSDSTGDFVFKLTGGYQPLDSTYGDSDVFKKAMNISPSVKTPVSESLGSDGASELLQIKSNTGKLYRVALSRNLSVTPISIKLINGPAEWRMSYLFHSQSY